jgi:hypothetical protein
MLNDLANLKLTFLFSRTMFVVIERTAIGRVLNPASSQPLCVMSCRVQYWFKGQTF